MKLFPEDDQMILSAYLKHDNAFPAYYRALDVMFKKPREQTDRDSYTMGEIVDCCSVYAVFAAFIVLSFIEYHI